MMSVLQGLRQPKLGFKTFIAVFVMAFSLCSSAKGLSDKDLIDLDQPVEQSVVELHAARHGYNVVRRTYIAGEFIPVEKSDAKDSKDPVASADASREVASLE